jgi:uncharacterized protein with FMN-binding domain
LQKTVLCVLAAIALPAVAFAATAITYDTPLDIDGIGPIKLGMTVKEAERISGAKFVIDDPLDDPSCVYARFTKGNEGIAFMVADGRIARVDIMDQATNKTRGGAAIGWTEEQVKKLYGKAVKVTKHAYAEGHYLTIKSADPKQGKLRYVFETEHGKVTQFRSGREPEVEYAEGCA